MKDFAKAFLPRGVINSLRDIKARQALVRTAKKNFTTQNLVTNDNFPVRVFLSAPALADFWHDDDAAISGVLGDQDKYGGVNPGDRRAIYSLIAAMKPANILEIGTHIGASTAYIAKALQRSGAGKLTSVDILDVNAVDAPWADLGLAYSPRKTLETLGCGEIVRFVQARAQDFLEQTQEKFDLVFLDGDHGAQSVYNEVSFALRTLAPGGVILLHDYYPGGKALFPDRNIIPGPYRAMKRICAQNGDIQVNPLGALPWPTKQGSNMTSLALVTKKS